MGRLESIPVLVTGAAGFIGSHLTRKLLVEGAAVAVLSNTVSQMKPPRLVDICDQIDIYEGNLTDVGALRDIVGRAKPRKIFHLGAYTHVNKSFTRVDECIQTNIQGTVNLLQAARETDYDRFIYTGTSEIYGDTAVPFREDAPVKPISPYSVSKHAGELYCNVFCEAYGWPIVMLRPFNAYGPMQSPDRIIPEVIVSSLVRRDIPMTKGEQTREFNYVEDLVEGFVLASIADEKVNGQIINLGCGKDHSIREMAETIVRIMGNGIAPQFGALPYRPTEIWRMFCDNTKARQLLGWQPKHDLESGLEKTIEWYAEEYARGDSPFLL